MDIEWLKSNIFPYINLAVFLFLLVKFGKKPFAAALQDRRVQFIRARDEAAKLLNEAKAENDKLEARLKMLKTEIEAIQNEAQKAAEWEGSQAIQKAQQLAQASIADAEAQVQTLAKEAEQRMRSRIVAEVVTQVTKQLDSAFSSNPELAHKILQQNVAIAADRIGELRQ
jgi:F0F1-type ATP synthase membrane subunit b/b'